MNLIGPVPVGFVIYALLCCKVPAFGSLVIGAWYLGHVAPDTTVTGGLVLDDTSFFVAHTTTSWA